jgi:hypothetical protein
MKDSYVFFPDLCMWVKEKNLCKDLKIKLDWWYFNG